MMEIEIEKKAALQKLQRLRDYLRELGSVLVAYSGGVDSALLLKTAQEVLGDRMMAVTVRSCFFPERESEEAQSFCRQEGIRHLICDLDVLQVRGVAQNPPDRCYLCKRELFRRLGQIAAEHAMMYVAEGSNMDDNRDYRPGLRAIKELGIRSPLRHAELTKAEIRFLAKQMGLSVWDKPSFACLASRLAYGEEITEEKLGQVEQAENILARLGFRQMRVRVHGQIARIEVDTGDFSRLIQQEIRAKIVREFRKLGFAYITLDLLGYRSGSMNETL